MYILNITRAIKRCLSMKRRTLYRIIPETPHKLSKTIRQAEKVA